MPLRRIETESNSVFFTYEPEKIHYIKFYNVKNPFTIIREMYGDIKDLQGRSLNKFNIVEIDVGKGEKSYRLETRFGNVYLTTATKVLNEEVNGLYRNVCVRCGTEIKSLIPQEQKIANGVTQPYVCPVCERRRELAFRTIPSSGLIAPSKFELFISKVLESLNVKYTQQLAIQTEVGFAIADFYIPCANLIIEADGNRYHTSEKLSPTTIDAIIHSAVRDMSKSFAYIRRGYNVLVLHENDFNISGGRYDKAFENERYELVREDILSLLKKLGCKQV